jgi:Cu(I)/Ag(I) efflux system membrane fusion protein
MMPAMGSMAEMRGKIPFGEAAETHHVRFTLEMAGKWFATIHVMAAGKHATLFYALNTVSKQFIFERSEPPAGAAEAAQGRAVPENGRPRVYIPDERRQLIGVTFAEADHRALTKMVRAFGRVTVNEQSLAAVNMQVGGWVRKVFVKDAGARVKAGDPLMTLYSPDLRAAQEELLIASRSNDEALQDAAEGKLRSLGMDAKQIEAVRKRGKASDEMIVRAPRDGYLVAKEVVEGGRVEPGMTVFRVGNLGRVWIVADVFEGDALHVREGQAATVRLRGAPAAVEAEVSYVYPTVDAASRTLPVRLEVRNPAETLKPGMAVDVYIETQLPHSLVVPREAVLAAGEHRYVFVDLGNGYLEPREIETAGGNDDWVRVTRGVSHGERVSTSANFLISSEARLQNALPKWGSEDGANQHEHHH